MLSIDLNCDLGEGGTDDAAIMPLISSCNIACGGHAGDEITIAQTVKLALAHHVNVGAHPSYPDKENFGRKSFPMEAAQLRATIQEQIERVRREAFRQGAKLHHVKPHGALYNELMTDEKKAALTIDAIAEVDSNLILFVPPHSKVKKLAERRLPVWVEGFADRNYEDDYSLTPRSQPGAVFTRKEIVFKQVLNMTKYKRVILKNGTVLHQKFDTICLHSDTENSSVLLQYLNKLLPKNEISIGLL